MADLIKPKEVRRQLEINQVRNDAQDQIKAASAADSLQQQVDKLLAGRRICDTRLA